MALSYPHSAAIYECAAAPECLMITRWTLTKQKKATTRKLVKTENKRIFLLIVFLWDLHHVSIMGIGHLPQGEQKEKSLQNSSIKRRDNW